MTRLHYAPRLQRDVDRITDHLLAHEVENIVGRLDEIFEAMQILVKHPQIGRPAASGARELVIGTGSRGYVALYWYDEAEDLVLVAALRSQREAGFEEG